jgi:hypothetical protein
MSAAILVSCFSMEKGLRHDGRMPFSMLEADSERRSRERLRQVTAAG